VGRSLLLLLLTAVGSLLTQNQAMVRFSNSEVVPLYFCFFSVGGVYGAALAYDELCWPGVLLLLPGLALCIGGVFCISYRREARVARLRAAAGAREEARNNGDRNGDSKQ